MSLDSSRFTFDAWADYAGVTMGQGRPQLDSDWNEWLAELNRRIQAGTMDIVGRAVYPATTRNAFSITVSAGALAIGAGRMYVDGLLAENHGPAASAVYDPALGELSGAPQIDGATATAVDYTAQPYLPGAQLPAGGKFLAYLDVWQREVTWLQNPNLIDKALAVDTSGRLQTVWQVKLFDLSKAGGSITCTTPNDDIPGWDALIAPSAGRLTNNVVNNTPSGPCCLASNTGYTGLENQFYRVEIHKGGGANNATFKWSRDNASVAQPVNAIAAVTNSAGNPASQLSVPSLGRDQVLGFAPGNWIEIIDDYLELNGQPGELHLIDGVDPTSNTITLDGTVSAASFPLNAGSTIPARHTRIVRWDQSGIVLKQDGTQWADLSAAGSSGIPVPPAGTVLILESGITVAFDLNPTTGVFRTGDYWNFAARVADGTIDPLVDACPRGILHHYAWLSVVAFPSTASDCRHPWPPATNAGGDCCCTATVNPSDITGNITLQTILDRYKGSAVPVVICLAPGDFLLSTPLRLTSAHSNISLKACQAKSVNIRVQPGSEKNFSDGMVVLDNVSGTHISGMYFAVPMVNFLTGGTFAGATVNGFAPDVQEVLKNLVVSIGLRPVNCTGLTVEDCEFGFADFQEDISNANATPFGIGIFAAGTCSDWKITSTTFAGEGNFLAGVLLAPQTNLTPSRIQRPTREFEEVAQPVKTTEAPEPSATENSPKTEAGLAKEDVVVTGIRKEPTGAELDLNGIWLNQASQSATSGLAKAGGTSLPAALDSAVFDGNSFSGTTVAVLLVGALQSVEFINNDLHGSRAGFWLVSPLQASLIPFDGNNIAMTGLMVALGYPLPQNDTTPATQMMKIPAAPASVRIYAGAKAFTDSEGNQWLPDNHANGVTVTGGALNQPTKPAAIADPLPAAGDQALYQSERFGNDFSYEFTKLTAGFYRLTLKFAEITWTNSKNNTGKRVFDIAVNNATVLQSLDIVADVGAETADDYTFSNVTPDAKGNITISFAGEELNSNSDTNAKIAAIDLEPQWNGILPRALSMQNAKFLPGTQETVNFYYQLAQLAQVAYVAAPLPPMILRIADNEMQGLSAPGLLVLGGDAVPTPNSSTLMLTGNRIFCSLDVSPNSNRLDSYGGGAIYFVAAATISAITNCIVNSNMIMNGGGVVEKRNYSFVLNDFAGAPVAPTTPKPCIMVSGNLFRGLVAIAPPRYPNSSNVPPPMNDWRFLNTLE